MINIDELQSQINSLQKCLDNYKLAESILETLNKHPKNIHYDERKRFAEYQLNTTEKTIIGQLKVNYMCNEKLINS